MAEASVVTVVQREASVLSAKKMATLNQTKILHDFIIDQAQHVADNREHFGEDAAAKLFVACEENMRAYLRGHREQSAMYDALTDVSSSVNNDMSAANVRAAFLTTVKEQSTKNSDEQALLDSSKEYRALKKIIETSNEASGHGSAAGPSGSTAEDMQVEEEGFTMTQATRSTKCPLLQVEMTEKGDLRPMRAGDCQHVFSWKALQESLKGGRNRTMKCPIPGCQAVLSLANLKDAKDVAREIRLREHGALD